MAKLNQIIAIEKGIKARVYSVVSEFHKINQKGDLFSGFVKSYKKKDDAGEDLPSETKQVQFVAEKVLIKLQRLHTELFDVTARKDWTNCVAVADVKVKDTVILKKVPVTYLLFLEKQLTDIRTFVSQLPILDSAERWHLDPNDGLYKSDIVKTHRTKKVQKPIVLYDATDKHPAQTQLITEDVIAGFWEQEKQSGALPATERSELMEKIETLLIAVKEAREEANNVDEITPPEVGDAIFGYLLGKE